MGKPLRLLIVEDSEDDALLVLRELRRGGYEPRFERVETAEEMEKALERGEWDCVISDYVLPKFSGPAALNLMKQSGLDLPFIVVSGNIGEDIAVESMRLGAHDYIIKGNLKRLVPAVEREIRDAGIRRERRLAETRVREAEAYNRSLIEASLDPLVTIDAEGRITDMNSATEKVTGHSRGELIGTEFSSLFTDADTARAGYHRVFREGTVRDYPLEIRHRNGHVTPVLYNASVYRNEGGEVVGVFAAARDITEIREAERRISAHNALLRLFSQTVSQKEYLDGVVKLMQEWSGCRCLGIRVLDEQARIPYESFTGFDREFWEIENRISTERDECVCVRVVRERPDPQEASCLTPYGSFYSNDAARFIEGLTAGQRARYLACPGAGFSSVAVVPVRYRTKTLGAIHMADEKPGTAPLKIVEFIESISPLVGEALYRFSIEDELRGNYEALRRSERSLVEAQRIAKLGNWEWDIRTNELHWSDEIYHIFGLDPRQFVATYVAFLNYIHADDREAVKKAINAALHERKPYSIEHRIVLDDGTLKIVHEEGEVAFDEPGEPLRMIGTIQDITERKIQEEKLRNSREQLRSLSAHLHTVREQERTSIAREIHDELGQTLTALKMDISWLGNKYKGQGPISEKTESMLSLIDSTIKTVKRISSELRPVALDDLGLVAAIEWQAEEFQKRTGIECRVTVRPDDVFLDKALSTAIFRIFQEALTNVMRHANATRVDISLEETEGTLVLRVEDNGRGISEKETAKPRSFGLLGIRERALFFGGSVRINGAPGKGTSITVTIPLEGVKNL